MERYGKFSPIAKLKERGKFPPYPTDSEDWFKFIDEQKEIFKKGYQVGSERITGEHYFQLNFCHMGITDARGNKVPTLPYYADWLKEAYDTYEDCKTTGENIIGLKRRDAGWTYFASALSLFQTQTEDFSDTMCIFPGGTSTAKTNFRKAYDMAYNQLHVDFKHPTLKDTEGKAMEELRYGFEVSQIDPKTKKQTGIKTTEGIQSKITLITLINTSVVRSGRSKLIVVEEAGEINGLRDLMTVVEANMREQGKKFGTLILGGTSNALNGGFVDFKYLWYNYQDFKFRKIWIPANKFYLPFANLITGESDLEGAKEVILKERALKKGKDLIIHQQEYPFTPEEAFFEGKDSPYNVEYANKQISRILSDKSIEKQIQRGNLYPKKDGKGGIVPVFEIEENGRFHILKHPDPSLKYKIVGGLDSYRMGKVTDSNSKGAIEMYVPFQGMNIPGSYPACVYWERFEDKDIFFMDALLAAIYYDTKILVELTDEDIISFFKTHNALNRLKERPNIIRSAYSKAENKYGILPTQHNMSMAAEYSIKEFNGNYDQIVFVELLREMIKFAPDVNTDRLWAHHWAVLHAMDNMKVLEEYKAPKREKTFSPFTATDTNGRLIPVRTIEQARQMGLIPQSINR